MQNNQVFIDEIDLLRSNIADNDYELGADHISQLMMIHQRTLIDSGYKSVLQRLSPEFTHAEMLVVRDPEGRPIPAGPAIIALNQRSLADQPAFQNWVQLQTDQSHAGPVLLAARWLCHLLGIRHATAHLILAVKSSQRQLLVQVRSMHKSASPGCYDLPVAGHVDGLQSFAETLRKESREELALDIDHLSRLHNLGGYVEVSFEPGQNFYNVEYHQVYAGILDPRLAHSLQPLPGEVAAVVQFAQAELNLLRRAYPAVVAHSLQETLDRYAVQIEALFS